VRTRPAAVFISMLALCAAAPMPAMAGFTSAQLAAISATPLPNAALPLQLSFRDENGRPLTLAAAVGGVPAVVVFADYTCHTLCGPILEFTAAGLERSGLRPGVDYRLIVIGLDPKNDLDRARAMRATHIDAADPIGRAAVFLSGGDADIRTATTAVGFNYAYDAEHDQYAHPAAAYIVDGAGRVRRMLSPLGLDGGDLRLALVDAGDGAVGGFADRIHLLCYGYDPVRGIYTERISTMLEIAAGATLLAMACGIFAMTRRERRRAAS
jgi:protein SCO1/2